jgi:Raf kinase inhibitor-like YbhB/YbcL family protein
MVWCVPEDATELRISLTDRDAARGTFTHWLVTGVDRATSKVEEGAVPVGGTEGRNDFGDTGYGGPCPPAGAPHRYVSRSRPSTQRERCWIGTDDDDLRTLGPWEAPGDGW